uniref:Uncharacterized protein n=1 Tax=Timema tahoe TaxID=61484 RepID=A0A7R9NWH7_9NEOP|nr:unnamed protein product [Timema tahoe]
MAENGCCLTVHNQQTVLAQNGAKRVHLQSSEHTESVTIAGSVNALDTTIPPMIMLRSSTGGYTHQPPLKLLAGYGLGFKATGLLPLNTEAIPETAFAPSILTEAPVRLVPEATDKENTLPFNSPKPPTSRSLQETSDPRNRTPGKKSLDSSASTSAANVQLDQTPVTHTERSYKHMVYSSDSDDDVPLSQLKETTPFHQLMPTTIKTTEKTPTIREKKSHELQTNVQPPEQNVGSRDFLQMDLPPSQDLEDISHSLVPPPLNSRSYSFNPSSPHLALLLLKSLLPSPCALAPPVPPVLTSRSYSSGPSSPHFVLLQSHFLSPSALASTVPLSLTSRSYSLSPPSPHLALLLLQSLLPSPHSLASKRLLPSLHALALPVSPSLCLLSFSSSPSSRSCSTSASFPLLALFFLQFLLPSLSYSTPPLLRERNVKRSKQVSDPNPGPSSSQTCVVNESTELIVVKEEHMSFDIDDMSNYNMTFVDVNQHESILAETSETPGTSRAESLFDERMSQQSLVSPSGQELETNGRQLQSAQLAEYALDPNSLTSSSQNISSKRKKSEGNGKRGYLTSCETSKTETDIRLHMVKLEVEQMREEHVTKMANLQRKMDIQLDQMKKEHESNMTNLQRKMNIQLDQMKKEHELNMANLQTKMDIQHEAKMKEHEIKMIELTGKTDQIRLKNEEIKKKMELDGTISELTVKKLREKINAIIMKREQVSQVHEVTVQALKQKLNNSYLENQILKMKQDALEK